ncbi:transcriptional regulator [Asticcacaulis sp. AC460]|uniref:type IV toxin-antitoxin system AbiEi family antitoxin domain-containing protein n=1 Tax=Asticcacaulis sp. AC460 TaxID=1282360 RepID=UPI0003C3DA78|nr:AbiEi antitoxin N-terminal domain-containing protein [Asticcacaulis sp. AC460]ESQ87937.1 transcriptional regulator [Asticcacaulis sp. AC460]
MISAPDSTQHERLRSALASQPLVRAFELRKLGIDATTISRAVERGDLVRVARGLYQKSDGEVEGEQSLAEASRLVPKGIIAMLSALAYHGVTDQMPRKVWLAIGSKDWAPKLSYPPIHFVRLGANYLNQGIEQHMISGVSVPIYGIAKTLADIFRHPKLIDRSAAVESLRQTLASRKATPAQIAEAAMAGRVWKTVHPYLEAMTCHG